ncbi:hypothetical protein SEA_DRYAD_92 [Streptomyces phage Dryad]|nr:hypothetical protein SEA_DRYAD_92 [Streptomyces phage Dryad]
MENDRRTVYEYFMTCNSQVKFSTFAIFNGVVNHDYIVVHSAPPRVMRELVGMLQMVSLREDGLLIPLTKESK